MNFFQFFFKYSIYHPLSADISFKVSSYNTFRDTAFTKFHPLVCQRAVILQGEIIQGKPEICVGYFSMRNAYMKFQDDISNMNTYIHTYIRTSRNQYVPDFFKVGGIKKNYYKGVIDCELLPNPQGIDTVLGLTT